MKRSIAFLLCAVMLISCLAFTGCGGGNKDYSDSKYVGTWKATTLSSDVLDESEELEDEFTLTLNADGTGTLSGGEDEDSTFTWTPKDNGFKTKGDVKMTFTDNGDNIKATIFGVDLNFEKQ